MCCAVRDKDGGEGAGLGKAPQFTCVDAEVTLVDEACFVTFSPLYTQEAAKPRHLAVASREEMCIFHRPSPATDLSSCLAGLCCTHRLRLDANLQINAILFVDDDNSRQVAVATGPTGCDPAAPNRGPGVHSTKVFVCDSSGTRPRPTREAPWSGVDWSFKNDAVAMLEGHTATIVKLVSNRQFVLSADLAGQVAIWAKPRLPGKVFERKAMALCHDGGVADACIDRSFAYTVGRQENRVCIWQLPELMPQVLSLPIDLHEELLNSLQPRLQPLPSTGPRLEMPTSKDCDATGAAGIRANALTPRSPIARVNLLRRPLSRWAGAPNVSKGAQPVQLPRGCLFVAAIVGAGCEVAGPGAGLLMEWTLGEHPNLHSLQVAHDSPIVSMTYGPYDNGPIITADTRGTFRVWEFSLDRGLQLSQQLSIMSALTPYDMASRVDWARYMLPPSVGWPAVVVEPPTSVYMVVRGRLFICQRLVDGAVGGPLVLGPSPMAFPTTDPGRIVHGTNERGPRLSTNWAN